MKNTAVNGKYSFSFCIIIALVLVAGCEISYKPSKGEFEEYVSLEGDWKFSIGDDLSWAELNYNDKDWTEIKVPSSWEEEGFHGYNGYAWYRKNFKLPYDYDGSNLYLHLGYIDDVDEVYINGKLIGSSGSFPPDYNSAYNAYRKYPIPGNVLKKGGRNILAVRVFDSQLAGGITSGNIGIFINTNEIKPDIDLIGKWKFNIGDNPKWKENNFNDNDWLSLFVPAYWDNQGFRDYDGFAWYRKEFTLPPELHNKKLVLLLGKIDDLDETYINGKLVGSTGEIKEDSTEISHNQEYQSLRGYFIPDDVLTDGKNLIAVRVYDGFKDGGIYEGPIGIVKQESYTKFWRERKRDRGFFD
jgi:hypothetical protein